MKRAFLPTLLVLLTALTACHKDDPITPVTPAAGRHAYVLSEGEWGNNDAEITLLNLDSGTAVPQWFSAANGRGLGDLAQDLVHYGGKLYCTVYEANTLEVIDPATGKSLRQISMGSRGPRYIACHGGKLYVSCYDKTVVRIDTAQLNIEATCPLSGMQPEQLCVANGALYVCNCWQYNAQNETEFDSTVSVVDLESFREVRKVTVGVNPGRIQPLGDGRLLVLCSGHPYRDDIPGNTAIINTADTSVTRMGTVMTNCAVHNGNVYYYTTTYDASWNPSALFYRADGATLPGTPIITSHSGTLSHAYGINIDPSTGDIYVCNSPARVFADVYCFAPDGSERWHAEAGNFASKVVF